jgi:polyisoprenoid-binding protein YceI
MKAENISGDVQANVKNSLVKDFSTGDIHVQVEKLESGKRIMNNKTYDALESNDHPKISFQLRSVENLYAAGSRFSGKAKGKLTIAGNSKMVTIPFSGKMNGNDEFSVNGDYSLKMSEYGVEPPSAMLGSLKTGDEVTIKYEMTFKEKSGMLTTKNK